MPLESTESSEPRLRFEIKVYAVNLRTCKELASTGARGRKLVSLEVARLFHLDRLSAQHTPSTMSDIQATCHAPGEPP